jgi:exopolyphosphatase/guanosine-5'-triphosphate,3'-diphosphate pyrophosphatase
MTDVVADGQATRTVAIESEDAADVQAAVREMGLSRYENLSYPRGLKRLVGSSTRERRAGCYAVIDVGTNSVKFHIGEKGPGGTWTTVDDRAEVTRLGEGLDASGGSFTPDAIERTAAAIEGMAAEARREGAPLVAVGTMGVRIARNRDDFVAAVERRCGARIEVISGEEEARLAYLAVRSGLGLGTGSLVLFDTGGGSSQFTFGRGAAVTERFSVNVGALRFTEKFALAGVVQPADLQRAMDAIAADLARLDSAAAPDTLVGMGGATTNLTAVMLGLREYDPEAVQGAVLTLREVERQIELYRSRSAEERRQIVGLQPERAEVILAGACIVRTILRKLRKDELAVSDRGLRHGLLVARFGDGSSA